MNKWIKKFLIFFLVSANVKLRIKKLRLQCNIFLAFYLQSRSRVSARCPSAAIADDGNAPKHVTNFSKLFDRRVDV